MSTIKNKTISYARCKQKILKYRCFLNNKITHTTHMTSYDEKNKIVIWDENNSKGAILCDFPIRSIPFDLG